MQNTYCNNCGKNGHVFNQCKSPITSFGIIAVKLGTPHAVATDSESSLSIQNGTHKYLVIRRKDTLGYIDFMRGKYSVYNKDYIMNMIKQMTKNEKERVHTLSFNELWEGLWGDGNIFEQYRSEKSSSRDKWTTLMSGVNTSTGFYTLKDLVEESHQYEEWDEPEWGFPKGRRDYHESDVECAVREFCEETGYTVNQLKIGTSRAKSTDIATSSLHLMYNVAPFEETFSGSNYKSYKHKYFIAFIPESSTVLPSHQQSEVSCMEWKTVDECLSCFRSYNLEKIRVIKNVDKMLQTIKVY